MSRPGQSPTVDDDAVDVVAADGGTVHLRPIRPDDADQILALNERVSDETLYYRFFSFRRRLSEAELTHLVTVDYRDRLALVAELAGQVIAVGRYDLVSEGEAEVAFIVEDAHQHRGLGTLLLEHLARLARRNGIDRFVAHTLADNRRMLGVFRSAGFRTHRSFEDGVWKVEFPIDELDEGPVARREQQAEARSLARVLEPEVIAVFGAGRRHDGIGHRILRNLLDGQLAAMVIPVHPEAESIAGVRTLSSLAELDRPADLAVVAVPAAEVPEVVAHCGEAGVGSLVVVSAGFAEEGPEGELAEAELVSLAHRHGMRLVGPNSLGVINTARGMRATFAPVDPPRGSLGLLSQSGMLAVGALQRAAELQVGISSFVSVGNRSDVSANDLLQYWSSDPFTRVCGLYLESFGNPRKFVRLARRLSASTPIIAVKSGRSHPDEGEFEDEVVESLFRQTGVIRVDTLDELLDTARVLDSQPLPQGPRVAIVGNNGGAGLMGLDAAVRARLVPAHLGDATRARLGANALGATGALVELRIGATGADYRRVVAALAADEGVDSVLVCYHAVASTPASDVAEAVSAAAEEEPGTPVLASFLAGEGVPPALRFEESPGAVPVFAFPEAAAAALGRVTRYADWRFHRSGPVPELDGVDITAARSAAAAGLADQASAEADEATGTALVAAVGIRVAEAPSADDPVWLGISNHPSFGPLVWAAARAPERRAYRVVPVTGDDAAALLRHLPGVDTGHLERPDLIELVVRVGLLADRVPEVHELSMGPVNADGSVARAHLTLRAAPTATDFLVRRLGRR